MELKTNRLAIIIDDGAVYTDDFYFINLDLSDFGIPPEVWALQWKDGTGEIEFRDNSHNQIINELPAWALHCYELHQSIPREVVEDPGSV
jgi:hypothetical protein